MTFEYRMLLGIAQELMDASEEERHNRSAVNRAYYAAFGEAKTLAESRGWTYQRRGGGSHEQVWRFLRRGAGATSSWERAKMKAIGDAGLVLKEIRTRGDYLPDAVLSRAEAAGAVQSARILTGRVIGAL